MPRTLSSAGGSAGNTENPAASPEVKPAGRSALLLRSNLAPLEACQLVPTNCACQVSQINPAPGCATIEWRSPPVLLTSCCHCCRVKPPVPLGQVSMGIFGGIGYGLGSDSSG